MELPKPEIEYRSDAKLYVVRDDRLPGGTKMRALPALLEPAGREVVYASPACGYAQLAIALAARAMGKRAFIFVAQRKQLHPRSQEAEAAGAKIIQIPNGYLNVVQARARSFAGTVGATLLPFGLDDPRFLEALSRVAIDLQGPEPEEVWSVAGSGVLTRALQLAWPKARFHAVRVGHAGDVGKAELHLAPEPFDKPASEPPPFSSCDNYDAKAWRFLKRKASPGALFWNVAG